MKKTRNNFLPRNSSDLIFCVKRKKDNKNPKMKGENNTETGRLIRLKRRYGTERSVVLSCLLQFVDHVISRRTVETYSECISTALQLDM